ncbi:FAD-binding oxidoreductase [Frigidibacter sp. ROC022]|uniref:FAD-binding oxidoreductase n=1 Tax=Frigidibacter sp. ROC022 TaxID=2971796 RepID=UPI00215A7C9E|nr:FAD-binding oxidoreductase [Frigidibacter sp. ROC022]MCR8725951.1 FAD-binding oxidoreductase [Frigidibacter sp. ROC022]
MDLIAELSAILGPSHVLTGTDAAPYGTDWMGQYPTRPLAVLRPGSTEEVSRCLSFTHAHGIAVVPIGGNTGLTGATTAEGQVMLSLERLNRIRELRSDTRIAIAEAGVVLSRLHEAADAEGLVFPLFFGARGSAMLGGNLSTNAGGSNVLRYGNTRALTLGLEVVLADGRVMNLMSELHKDNAGYDLKDLFIGAEGTLGIITAAVLKLFPKPRAYATALVAMDSLAPARTLLNRLQDASGGAVEAFEYMPDNYMERLARMKPELASPLAADTKVSILVEIGATAPRDVLPGPDGTLPVTAMLTEILESAAAEGLIQDAVVATSEAQRKKLWSMRETAAELVAGGINKIDNDICLPLHLVEEFLDTARERLKALDPGATIFVVGHLGDGNLHYTVLPTFTDPDRIDEVREMVEEIVSSLRGSFSAEHGIGISKLPSMARRKDRLALDVMRTIKTALDPKGLMNPGKVLPPE